MPSAAADTTAVTYIQGRVGAKRASFSVSKPAERVLRVNCHNHPDFWLEINLASNTVRGCLGDGLGPVHGGDFYMEVSPVDEPADESSGEHMTCGMLVSVRVDHSVCHPFWLQLTTKLD